MIVYQGTLAHATDEQPMQILPNHFIGVENGKICFMENSWDNVSDRYGVNKSDVVCLHDSEFLIPGFVDCHLHPHFYELAGTKLGLPLFDWLDQYMWPTEVKFQDVNHAKHVQSAIVNKALRCGTTTACYFASRNLDATIALYDEVEKIGQRAYIGKSCLDTLAPDSCIEDTQQSLKDTRTLIEHILSKKNVLITPVVTPLISLACTEQLLKGLGEIAHHYNLPIQTHIAETKNEHKMVEQMFPKSIHGADVYDSCDLITNKTILAHGIYLSDAELDVIRTKGAGIVHCPIIQLGLQCGTFDCRKTLQSPVKVGLGTDNSTSLLANQRTSVQLSNAISFSKPDDYQALNYKEAFRLSTLGGSKVMNLDDKIGNFEVGKEFDALRVNGLVASSPYDIFESDTLEDYVSKFLHLGDDRNITDVFVSGSKVM